MSFLFPFACYMIVFQQSFGNTSAFNPRWGGGGVGGVADANRNSGSLYRRQCRATMPEFSFV